MSEENEHTEPTREEITSYPGAVLLEFGTAWCGYCQQLAPVVGDLLRSHPDVTHIKVEDGPGRPLGRSFRVKLWPTFVFLKEGEVVQESVRPDRKEVAQGLAKISPLAAG